MSDELISIIVNLIQIVSFCFILFMIGRRMRSRRFSRLLLFFLYGIILALLSILFWLVHDIMRPEARIPFGANEIGEISISLMYASLLDIRFKAAGYKNLKPATLLTIIYSLAVIALWIGWTGEWIKDILSGTAFGYMMCMSVRSLIISKAFNKIKLTVLALGAYILIGLQGLIFIVPENIGKVVDILCYIILFSGIFWLLIYSVYLIRTAFRAIKGSSEDQKKRVDKALAVTFAALIWALNTMYMSAGTMYVIAYIIETVVYLILFMAISAAEETEFPDTVKGGVSV
ncbi:MAG: hypothetical protein K5795_05615 [Lachnospiraceae bacterium]|nr:hypothetical protein [Lachnospiraceae bacterium]